MRIFAAILAIGCAESAPESPMQPPLLAKAPLPKLPSWRGNRTLPMLPASAAKLDAYLAATKAWHTATTAYSLGDAIGSAEAFLSSASHLKDGPEPISKAFAAGRCLAYENAVRAYAAANRLEEARAKLTALADQSCRHSIAAALDRAKHEQPMPEKPKSPLWRPF